MGLGHAFEMDPKTEDGFLLELSQAIMAREIFPKASLKYMPPTKFMTGNIFMGHIQDALFNLVAIWSSQSLLLQGMLTEAIHNVMAGAVTVADPALGERLQYRLNTTGATVVPAKNPWRLYEEDTPRHARAGSACPPGRVGGRLRRPVPGGVQLPAPDHGAPGLAVDRKSVV